MSRTDTPIDISEAYLEKIKKEIGDSPSKLRNYLVANLRQIYNSYSNKNETALDKIRNNIYLDEKGNPNEEILKLKGRGTDESSIGRIFSEKRVTRALAKLIQICLERTCIAKDSEDIIRVFIDSACNKIQTQTVSNTNSLESSQDSHYIIYYWKGFKEIGLARLKVDALTSGTDVYCCEFESTDFNERKFTWQFLMKGKAKKSAKLFNFTMDDGRGNFTNLLFALSEKGSNEWCAGNYTWVDAINEVVGGKFIAQKVYKDGDDKTVKNYLRDLFTLFYNYQASGFNLKTEEAIEHTKDLNNFNILFGNLYNKRTSAEVIKNLNDLRSSKGIFKKIEAKNLTGCYKGFFLNTNPDHMGINVVKCTLHNTGYVTYEFLDSSGIQQYTGIISAFKDDNIVVELKSEDDLFHPFTAILKQVQKSFPKKQQIILEGVYSGISEISHVPLSGYAVLVKTDEEFKPSFLNVTAEEFQKFNNGFSDQFDILHNYLNSNYYPSPYFFNSTGLINSTTFADQKTTKGFLHLAGVYENYLAKPVINTKSKHSPNFKPRLEIVKYFLEISNDGKVVIQTSHDKIGHYTGQATKSGDNLLIVRIDKRYHEGLEINFPAQFVFYVRFEETSREIIYGVSVSKTSDGAPIAYRELLIPTKKKKLTDLKEDDFLRLLVTPAGFEDLNNNSEPFKIKANTNLYKIVRKLTSKSDNFIKSFKDEDLSHLKKFDYGFLFLAAAILVNNFPDEFERSDLIEKADEKSLWARKHINQLLEEALLHGLFFDKELIRKVIKKNLLNDQAKAYLTDILKL